MDFKSISTYFLMYEKLSYILYSITNTVLESFPFVGYVLIVLFVLFLVLQIVCKIGMMWIYLDLFKLFAFVNDKINLNLPLFSVHH